MYFLLNESAMQLCCERPYETITFAMEALENEAEQWMHEHFGKRNCLSKRFASEKQAIETAIVGSVVQDMYVLISDATGQGQTVRVVQLSRDATSGGGWFASWWQQPNTLLPSVAKEKAKFRLLSLQEKSRLSRDPASSTTTTTSLVASISGFVSPTPTVRILPSLRTQMMNEMLNSVAFKKRMQLQQHEEIVVS